MFFCVTLPILALICFLMWRICEKAGYNGAMGLLVLIPGIGLLILVCILAFDTWPIHRVQPYGVPPQVPYGVQPPPYQYQQQGMPYQQPPPYQQQGYQQGYQHPPTSYEQPRSSYDPNIPPY
jgi:hypothetical protein